MKKLLVPCFAAALGACVSAPEIVVSDSSSDAPIMGRTVPPSVTGDILSRAQQCATLATKPVSGAEHACCLPQPKLYVATVKQWGQIGCSTTTMSYYVCSFVLAERGQTAYYIPETANDRQNHCN